MQRQFKKNLQKVVLPFGLKGPSYLTAVKWVKRFCDTRQDVTDDSLSSRLVFKLTDENIKLVGQIINNNPHSIYNDIINDTSLYLDIIERTIYECTKMKKVAPPWLPN